MPGEKEDKGFRVVDKRSFDTEGEEKQPEAEPAAAAPAADEPRAEPAAPEPGAERVPIPEIDFVTFILSLYHSAGCHLGLSPNPETQACEENLPLAKETIDILGMLQEKTQGNLTGEEERLLSEILYNLRMAFVKTRQK